MTKTEKIAIKIHPRAFTAFGADLVTNDTVAITELVKNCYDAFAIDVEVSFNIDKNGEPYIDIRDDGCGMTRAIIDSAWSTIATPFKKNKPSIERIVNGKKQTRIVSGNKGLGRFSAARLGSIMIMVTKSDSEPCWRAEFDWDMLSSESSLEDCFMTIKESTVNPFEENGSKTGTIIRIKGLKSIWNDKKIEQLKEDLARLLSPFKTTDDFRIKIKDSENPVPVIITPAMFLNNPKYKIEGTVNNCGEIQWNYFYNDQKINRKSNGIISWNTEKFPLQLSLFTDNNGEYSCGPFSFEIRAWDLDKESIEDVSTTFNIKKRDIRQTISKYKGISVYRDNVLVLPKSEASRDWLGLDAKRISDLGRRISTSQIVGIVYVSAENNPEIKDTTDREKLVDTTEYQQFIQILYDIVDKLQVERMKDHLEEKRATINDLITPLSSKDLLNRATLAAAKGSDVNTIVKYIEEYDEKNERNLTDLSRRLVYYAQTASLGSIAIIILHEFLTGMNSIKRFLNRCKEYITVFDDRTNEYLDDANKGHERIREVANSFAPLYRQNLRNENNRCDLLEMIELSKRLVKSKKISKDVNFVINVEKNIKVKMHEGELQTIFINLFDNACFWLNEESPGKKEIRVSAKLISDQRYQVTVSDNGPGIPKDEAEKIFNPGITSKKRGIGMGLVIVTELLSYYNGKIATTIPGDLDGATFFFDIPVEEV
ncbi:sensor histidine kinase [Lacrimispora sp.]|uniref:sensor histidine kinase n=1 Tax=Lacrimispora sp. TaxID=2719234 RepID=UPI002FD8E6FE